MDISLHTLQRCVNSVTARRYGAYVTPIDGVYRNHARAIGGLVSAALVAAWQRQGAVVATTDANPYPAWLTGWCAADVVGVVTSRVAKGLPPEEIARRGFVRACVLGIGPTQKEQWVTLHVGGPTLGAHYGATDRFEPFGSVAAYPYEPSVSVGTPSVDGATALRFLAAFKRGV